MKLWMYVYVRRYAPCQLLQKQEIRFIELGVCPMQHFHFLITWRSSSSNSAAVYKISSKSDDFSLKYSDITIFKRRPSPSRNCFTTIRDHSRSLCCWPQLPVKFRVKLIHRSEDSYFIFSHIWLAWDAYSSPQNGGFGGLWTPKCGYSSSRPLTGTSLRKSASVKLSTVKIRWGSDL